MRMLVLPQVDSSNAEAFRLALKGETGPLYIRAERQTAGRGRSGRAWSAPNGNLALSRLGPLQCPPQAVPQISLVAGVAVHRACAALLSGYEAAVARLHLKWPNDLLLDGAKLAGILIESTTVGGQSIAVIGIGINLSTAPEVAGRRTAALAEVAGRSIPPAEAAECVVVHLEQALSAWAEARAFNLIRAQWLERATPVGAAMTIETGNGRIGGAFAGLDAGGALLLRTSSGTLQTFTYGDVTLASEQEMS